jgi:glycosyltransferase involved in cell wall biosynthesis
LWGARREVVQAAYTRADVAGAVVVSKDNLDYLRYVFPDVDVTRIVYMIDPAVFHTGGAKNRTIAYMPRKRAEEATEVLALVGARGALDEWQVVPIAGRSQSETADLLRSAAVFLSFSLREGFGLPPAEALACGCVVVGFHGFGGTDIGDHPLWVPDGDVVAFARTLEDVLRTWDTERDRWTKRALDGAAHVREAFAPERFRETVVAAFSSLAPAAGGHSIGEIPSTFWRIGSRWPWVARHLRSAARVAIRGGT